MSTVTLDGENGREVVLQRLSERDDESIWEFQATLHLPHATATKRVYEHGTELRAFFHELAEAWRGFEGVKTYASLEGEFMIEAEHDGHGTVKCCVTLRSPAPPEWSLRAVVEFGSGAHLERLSRGIDAFVP